MAFDEQGQADTVERKVAICERAYDCSSTSRLRRRGRHLRPERARGRDRHRGARRLREGVHRGAAADQGALSRCAYLAAASRTSRFSFRGNDVVREAMHAAFLYHAIQAGLDMGIVNAGQLAVYEDIDPELLEHVEDVIWNRRPDATERLVELASRVQGRGRRGARSTSRGARRRSRSGSQHALVHGIVDFIEEDTEEARQRCRAAARRDRGAADGRHAGRRRPLRRRADVPAAGREERAGDEARGRLPRAVHGGREAAAERRAAPGEGRARDRQGRRARHRQEHRRGRARLQQLRGRRPRRDGPGGQDPRHGRRARAPTSSASPA